MEKNDISISVIKRLPRYYRFLENLKENGIVRISSKELAERMGLTASQIRHDFNCFGGFGQQGYGYNVPELYNKIGEILCVNNDVRQYLSVREISARLLRQKFSQDKAVLNLSAFLTRTRLFQAK